MPCVQLCLSAVAAIDLANASVGHTSSTRRNHTQSREPIRLEKRKSPQTVSRRIIICHVDHAYSVFMSISARDHFFSSHVLHAFLVSFYKLIFLQAVPFGLYRDFLVWMGGLQWPLGIMICQFPPGCCPVVGLEGGPK